MSGVWNKVESTRRGAGVERSTTPVLRYLWLACVVLLLAAAGLVYAQGRSAAELHAEAVREAAVGSDASTGPVISPSPSFTSGVGASAPTTGPGIDALGTMISARVSGPDTILISESVRVAEPISVLVITLPDFKGVGGQLSSLTPALADVQISAGGQMVPILKDRVDKPLRLDLPAPATSIEVRYVLTSGIVRTLPSKAGRALAGLRPVVEAGETAPVAYVFGGEEIVGVSCPDLGPTKYACAEGKPGQLTVRAPPPRSQSLALLQINLPRL